MELSKEIKDKIKMHAEQCGPQYECCGLIVDSHIPVRACKNIHPNPTGAFRISPEEVEEAQTWGQIKAFYHSHPDKEDGLDWFSDSDKLMAEKLRIPCVLYYRGKFYVYEPQNYQIPLVGRQFLLGSLDCLTLVADYYREKLNLIIPDLIHPYRYDFEEWVARQDKGEGDNLLFNYFRANHFKPCSDLKKHDVIITRSKIIHFPVHCLIYIGGNTVLHHPFNKKSEVTPYSNFLKTLTKHIFRHEKV